MEGYVTLFDQAGQNSSSIYRRLRDTDDAGDMEQRSYIDQLWTRTKPYLDSNFSSAFARDPQQRYWELRLAAALLDTGYILELNGEGRPDIATRLPSGERLWIEAVAPTLGAPNNPDRPPELIPDGKFRSVPIDQILMRYTQAIREKRDRFRVYRDAGVVNPEDRCVIALNSGGLWPHVEGVGLPRVLNAVYPLGNERVILDNKTGKILRVEREYRGEILRGNGANIPLTAFLDPEYAQISGIIADTARVTGWHQQGNQRFVSVNNPTTTAALPSGFFKLGTEYRGEQNGDGYSLTRKEHEISGVPSGANPAC